MSTTITRLETVGSTFMQPVLEGDSLSYVEKHEPAAHAYRCDTCGLVWGKRWYAQTCPERNHRPSFEQHYPRYQLQGTRYVDIGDTFTRVALRRESVQP